MENPNTADNEQVEDAATADTPDTDALTAEVEKYKALAAKWEARSKDNFEKLKSSPKPSQLDTIAADLSALKAENKNLKVSALAAKYSLPAKVASQLSGETADELEQDAQDWAATLFPEGAPAAPKTAPKPVFTQGPSGDKPAAPKALSSADEMRKFIASKQAQN